MKVTIFKSQACCIMHTVSHWAKRSSRVSWLCKPEGSLFTCRSATLGWIAPTEQSSGLQITVKRPGQGYRFLWALVPWSHLWLYSQIYKNKPAHFWGAEGNTDEEIFIHSVKEMSKCNYYFELWNQATLQRMPKCGLCSVPCLASWALARNEHWRFALISGKH